MPKNIVVCCDGTSNEYGDRNTNVVKLYSALTKTSGSQVALYDPGVGTLTGPAALTQPVRVVRWLLGLAFGYGLTKNIRDAYRFLMQTYEPGDRIFLFGFSRGAYTARAVAGLVHKCGILAPNNDNLIPYALKIFKQHMTGKVSNGFRATFSRRAEIQFLGLWDTVSSIGWIYDPKTLPHTFHNSSVRVVRHAVSLGERRCFYRQNLWGPLDDQDVKQVWFPGDHCDVGGSHPEAESGLSHTTLGWMLDEAAAHGLQLDPDRIKKLQSPAQAVHHDLLRSNRLWWIPELVPKLYKARIGNSDDSSDDNTDEFQTKLRIPLGQPRVLPEGSLVHASALHGTPPKNLPSNYTVEPPEPEANL